MNNLNIDGGILAGGLSSRFGNLNKAFAELDGKPLIKHVAEKLSPHVNKLFISCNHDFNRYEELGFELVSDQSEELLGPLAGVSAILNRSSADYLIICPCDTPLIPTEFVAILKDELLNMIKAEGDKPYLLAIRSKEKFHPLHLCIHRSYLANVESYLSDGKRRVMSWVESNDIRWIDLAGQEKCFANINTPDALNALSKET